MTTVAPDATQQATKADDQTRRTIWPDWAGAGVSLKNCQDVNEALEKADLNWEVALRKIKTVEDDPDLDIPNLHDPITFRNSFGIIRITEDGDPNIDLGVVGNRYSPLQNSECASLVQEIIDSRKKSQDEVFIERAGSIFDGQRVWMALSLGNLQVGPRLIKRSVMASWSHDGTLSLRGSFFPVEQKKNSIIRIGFGKRSAFKDHVAIKHTKNAASRILESQRVLNSATNYFGKLGDVFKILMGENMTAKEMETLVEVLFPESEEGKVSKRTEETRNKLYGIYESPEMKDVQGTRLGAILSVSEFVTHHQGSKASGEKDASEVRLNSLCFGPKNTNRTQEAFEWLTKDLSI